MRNCSIARVSDPTYPSDCVVKNVSTTTAILRSCGLGKTLRLVTGTTQIPPVADIAFVTVKQLRPYCERSTRLTKVLRATAVGPLDMWGLAGSIQAVPAMSR